MFKSLCNVNSYSAENECSAFFSCSSLNGDMSLCAHTALAVCAFLFLMAGVLANAIISAVIICSVIISVIIIAVIISYNRIYALRKKTFDF